MRRSPSSVLIPDTLIDIVRSSFRRKLATALLIVFLIIGIATVGLYVQIGGLLKENVEQSMTAVAETEANELSEWTERNRLIVRLLSDHPIYLNGVESEVRTYLRIQREQQPDVSIVRAYVIDRLNRTVTASTNPTMEEKTVGTLSWNKRFSFQEFDSVQMTEPYTVKGTTVIGFISPIHRAPEQLLVVEVDTTSVFERLGDPVDGGFTRIVSSDGTIVFSDDTSVTFRQCLGGPRCDSIVSSGPPGNSGFVESPAYKDRPETASEYVAAYAAVPSTDWVVIEHVPANDAYTITRKALQYVSEVSIFSLLALVGVFSVLGRDLAGALSRLTNRAKRIENGQYDVKFDTSRPDEFGDLNRTVASIRDALQQRIKDIREAKSELKSANTALEERSEMVDVLNRILRHNVRNEVNVITGRAELAASRVDDEETQADLEAVQTAAWELSTIAARTQRIKQMLAGEGEEPKPHHLNEELVSKLTDIESNTQCASVEFERCTSDPVVEITQTFPTAVADVVERIATYNEDDVEITVSISTQNTESDPEGETVVILIDDDSNGLPALDVEAIKAGKETPLNHAEGLELWCLKWVVAKSKGELLVAPDNATLKIDFPPASVTV